MRKFCLKKIAEHRIEQAKSGWTLLRGCPNTNAIRRLAYLDTLPSHLQIALAKQMSEFEETEINTPPATLEERAQLLEKYPELRAYFDDINNGGTYRGIGKIPVKVIAGVRRDVNVGGIEGWAKLAGLEKKDLVPPTPHAKALEDLTPARPQILRKHISKLMTAKFKTEEIKSDRETTLYKGTIGDLGFTLHINFAHKGSRMTRQLMYYLQYHSSTGLQTGLIDYESFMRIPGIWDYITESNMEQSVDHLGNLVEVCASLI